MEPPFKIDNDSRHSKLCKSAVEFFAGQVAHLFKLGRCGACDKCKESGANLGVYFMKCLLRDLGINVVRFDFELRSEDPSVEPPMDPPPEGLN